MRPQVKNWLQVAQEMYLPLEKATVVRAALRPVAKHWLELGRHSPARDFHQAMAPVALPLHAGGVAPAGEGCAGGFAPGCAGAFAAAGEAFAGAGLPPGDPAGAGCAAAGSSSAGAALPMFAKSGPSLVFPISAGRSKM
jgi:hypothetical protein